MTNQPRVRALPDSIVEDRQPRPVAQLDEVEELRLEVEDLRAKLEQLTNPNPVPVSDVMARYSALQNGPGGGFSHPPVKVETPEGLKRRAVGNALDSIQGLIQGTVSTRGGQSVVIRRENTEGGMILQLSLPAAGVLAPSGVSEVLQQITQVVRNDFPAARLDVLRQVSVGLGSPVSQNDGRHITTLRVLVPLPQDISPTNNLDRNLKAVRAGD
jgi:hypothetical protein